MSRTSTELNRSSDQSCVGESIWPAPTDHSHVRSDQGSDPVRFGFTVNNGSLSDTTDVALFDRVLGGDLPFAWGTHGPTPDHGPLPTPEEMADFLPPNGRLTRSYEVVHGVQVIGEGPGYLAQVALSPGWMMVRVASDSPSLARTVGQTILERMPTPTEDADPDPAEIRMRVWCNGKSGPRTTWATTRAPSWCETARNYPSVTAEGLQRLIDARPDEAGGMGGSLILFHGPPGVGKTSAIRTLVREWSAWCDFENLTDPEKLLSDPQYLLSVVEGRKANAGADPSPGRLRCLVLEDADNYLRAEAGGREPAISRLLNAADGVLGNMGLLVLLTMNTPARRLNPALLRPGRMIASIGFERFGRTEAQRWLGTSGELPTGEASLAELLQARGDLTQISTASPEVNGGYL